MSNKYQAYAEYKDSGVELLGQIPKEWEVKKAKYLFQLETGGTPSTSNDKNFDDYGIPWVKPDNLNEFIEITNTQKHVSKVGQEGIPIIPKGSILVCGIGTVGKFGVAGKVLITNQQINAFIPDVDAIDSNFAKYLLASSTEQLELTANKVVVAISNKTSMQNISLCVPHRKEQLQIANFLDHETAEIDTLIEKQQQLIKLLKEKRQAVISHAVTKGLDPSAPMRDSGVEWLGEVPENWVVGRYKFCTSRIVVGIAEAATHAYAEVGVPIIRSTNIKEEGLDTSGMLFIKEEFAEKNESKYLYTNDIVTVRTGYPGISSVIPGELDKSQCFTNLVASPKKNILPRFLAEYLNSHIGKSYFDLLGWGSAQKNISVPILQNVPIAWPMEDEQNEIMSFVQSQRGRYTNLVCKAEDQIDLLQERRTALISAAVTGKIDLRNWQAPEPSNKNNREIPA